MKIQKLEVQGFRSFAAPQVLDFSAMQPGLYHVAGRNEVEPELEGNGAGKSSLFEAVHWGLYGRTSRGLKAGAVKNWHSKEKCAVGLEFQATNGTAALLRVWQPNVLEVMQDGDPRPVDQQGLEEIIGIAPSAFSLAVYFAQFTPAFIDMEPRQQTEIFTDVLNLSLWDDAAAKASGLELLAEEEEQRLHLEQAALDGQVKELLATDYEAQEIQWATERRSELKTADDEYRICKNALDDAKRKKLIAAQHDTHLFMQTKGKADKEAVILGELQATDRHVAADIAALEKQNITKCPSCGAPVSREHVKEELARLNAMREETGLALRRQQVKHSALLKQLEDGKEAEAELSAAERAMVRCDANLKNAARACSAITDQKNPFTALREQSEQRGEELVGQLERIQAELAAAQAKIKRAQFWIKAFKEIRLAEIKNSLDQLTLEANEALFQLGLQDWAISFDVERETKSGTISRQFTAMIKAPHTKAAVPWEAWSGGESQRLRLSVSMGFANLVCSRMGVAPNIEFWDEPSTWLSEAGIQDLLQVLTERAQRQQKIILLADHRALDYGGFAGTITLVKNKEGSRIDEKYRADDTRL